MSVENLMKPRMKVEFSHYPESMFTQGQIIEFEDKKEIWYTGILEYVSKPIKHKDGGIVGSMAYSYFEKYPKVFRLMEWWEDRKEEDMPEYVKESNGDIWKVKEKTTLWVWVYICHHNEHQIKNIWFKDGLLPATKEEYEHQNNK